MVERLARWSMVRRVSTFIADDASRSRNMGVGWAVVSGLILVLIVGVILLALGVALVGTSGAAFMVGGALLGTGMGRWARRGG
jgi:hypothetical protein